MNLLVNGSLAAAVCGCLLSLLSLQTNAVMAAAAVAAVGVASSTSRGPWLVDLIDYDYQGDSPKEEDTSSSQEACPSVSKTYSQSACQQSQCKTDQDCKNNKHKRCCFNGCIYTCTQPIDEPALIDWRVAPRRIVKSDQSCSTSKVLDDGDPLLCPDGYVCHIVTPENHKHNIPNRGWCVKEKDDRNHMKDYEQREQKTKHIDPTSCYEDSIVFLNGASVHYKGKWCNCIEGKLTCKRKRRT
ncbi:four-disulfide core domain 1 isoform X2 [Octopus vulgaris]|uniref:Four-disulfide core domain 1 isoform X2 n=1 Tax=Octopus vulgaris TaxID=6645 RepID=A0AA36BAI3_OCTVU|nr:four-disulfide core domain 1 isoform X2 [Octopus vulgaris]